MMDLQIKKKKSATCPRTGSAEVRSKSRATALSVTVSINFGSLYSTGRPLLAYKKEWIKVNEKIGCL